MAEGFAVVAEQLRAHARNVDAVRDRFGAVKAASAHITQNGNAYGMLCSWMPAVLESRHVRQNELIAYVEENLSLVAQRLLENAEAYEEADRYAADSINAVTGEPGWTR
jgi:hypothetical protein